MTTTDMVLRVNDALRNNDLDDLEELRQQLRGLLMDDTARDAWLALVETAESVLMGEL